MALGNYYGAIRGTDFEVEVEASSTQDARYKIARAYRLKHHREKMISILARVISKRISLTLQGRIK